MDTIRNGLTSFSRAARRLAFNPVKKETFQEGINPDGTPHSKWKGYYYTVSIEHSGWVVVRLRLCFRCRVCASRPTERSSAVCQRVRFQWHAW